MAGYKITPHISEKYPALSQQIRVMDEAVLRLMDARRGEREDRLVSQFAVEVQRISILNGELVARGRSP
ncbi:hypothetical protein SCP_1702210 [Sparassis crispa]|uniref:Uncharacterized protein n=1 Tax=Sparassis crispa TaxID=139825 RepID=A0A401H627_9APHY|nr:hypothetical protein SCP_1702210 [Sparassis crispa]GBE89895.1 hypothetical protein SCP_1702210 [Sparassis crispa]